MLFGTNLTRRAQRDPAIVLVVVHQKEVARSRFVTTTHVQSFALISMLRGRPKTPPSGDDLAVLDYHLNGEFSFKIMSHVPLAPSIVRSLKHRLALQNEYWGKE